jgi:hypothetical protein
MRTGRIAACLLAALAGACQSPAPRPANEHPQAAQTQPLLAAPVRQAVGQLASPTPDDRTEALRQVVSAINQNAAEVYYVTQIVGLIQRNITAQLRELSRVEDPEARLRLSEVLAFNEALSRFAIDMLELPPAQRQTMLAWGLDPKNVEIVGQCWAGDPEVRAQAARNLATRTGPEPERVLVHLIEDDDRMVALTALDLAADRPPSEALVEAVWRRAIEYPMRMYGSNWGFAALVEQSTSEKPVAPPRQKTLYIHGRIVQINSTDTFYLRAQDAEVATEVLLAYKSPLVEARLNKMFEALSDGTRDPYGYRFRMFSPNYSGIAVYLMRLVDAYKPKAFVPCIMVMGAARFSDGYTQQINNQSFRISSRVEALGLLVQFTGQNKEDYGLTHLQPWGNRWMLVGEEKEEEAAAKKMRDWWGDHYKEYGAKDAKLPEAGAGGSWRGGWGRRGMIDFGG